MKKLKYFLIAGSFILLSCNDNNGNGRNPQSRELYEKSVSIGLLYSDSLKLAKDSSEVLRLSKEYEDALTKVNYSYSPDLGLEISEGENDTLTNIALRYVEIKDSLLRHFAKGNTSVINDTTLNDAEIVSNK